MKTTIELADDLMMAAKRLALRRRITLKELFTRALEREVRSMEPRPRVAFVLDEHGIPSLPKRGAVITSELIRSLMEDEDERILTSASA
jgi:predicted ArsR family transcriptional regulator